MATKPITTQLVDETGVFIPVLPVSFGAPSASPIDLSGTITAGGVAQTRTLSARSGFSLCNIDANDIWFSFAGTIAGPNLIGSILIPAGGGYYENPTSMRVPSSISIYGATTGQKFTLYNW